MNREEELALLIEQQSREDTQRQQRESFVALSLDHVGVVGIDIGDIKEHIRGCPLHGLSRMKVRNADGALICLECLRISKWNQRRRKGIPVKPYMNRSKTVMPELKVSDE